ncbi:MAG: DNA alkylation repair protein [Bdellovibrio sp.]
MNHYIVEIENILSLSPMRISSQHPESYIGGGHSKLRFVGLRVPQLQQAMHNGFSFSEAETDKQAKIWDYIWWNSDCYEVMSLALAWYYDNKQRKILSQHWSKLKKWSEKIDNWAHSDSLSGIYARILEENPEKVYPTLVEWNSSTNPWLRRLSIVSLLYYSSQRKEFLPLKKILTLVQSQLDYDHYYVQKGVGWTLREAFNIYPDATFSFMKKNVRNISAQAFSAATEKLTSKQKMQLKKLRKRKKVGKRNLLKSKNKK